MITQKYFGIRKGFLLCDKSFVGHKTFKSNSQYVKELKRCYEVLNIKENSDQESIRRAYLDLAKRFHPDSGSPEADQEKFSEIESAFRFLNKKNSQDRWDVDEKMRAEEFDIKHTAPQHRQYLTYDGVGFGTPAQREKQWQKRRAMQAAYNVTEHRIAKAIAVDGALIEKSTKTEKHNIKTKYGFDRLVEDLIQEAMSKGEFNNLPGSGKPLSTHQNVNPYVDFVTHKMNQVLIDNGFTPEWIRLQKDIRQEIEILRSSLFANRSLLGPTPLTPEDSHEWDLSIKKHKQLSQNINAKITHFNLVVPILQKQMCLICLEKEARNALINGENNSRVIRKNYCQNNDNKESETFISFMLSIFKH